MSSPSVAQPRFPPPLPDAEPSAESDSEATHPLSFQVLWRNVTFLLALTTYASLLITRELDPVTIILFPAILFLAWFLKSPPRFWQTWMGYALTLAVIAVLARLAYEEYFRTLLRLLLFLVLYKCFTLKSSRDYLQVQVLCFFILVATAVITVTYLFSFIFPIYLTLEVFALALYSIGKNRESLGVRSGVRRSEVGGTWQGLGSLSSRFLGSAFAGSLVVMGLVILAFYFIPHYSLQKLDAPLAPRRSRPNTVAVSGFGEDVKLGEFKKIQPDGTVVMRVEVRLEEGEPRPEFLRLRGVALDRYENNRWRRDPETRGSRVFNSMIRRIRIEPKSLLEASRLHQKIYQNPNITLRLFGSSFPVQFEFDEMIWARRDTGVSTYQATAPSKPGQRGFTDPFIYRVTSGVVPEAPEFLPEHIDWQRQNPRRLRDPKYRLQRFVYFNNTQLAQNALSYEIRDLSRRVAPGPSSAEKVLQLFEYLRTNYAYTLEPNTPDDVDPVRAFLFETRQGHCEFFATAMVLMLRAQGIPARIVNGFYTTDWNEAAGVFLVKQSDAHSWVEVWLDGVGWLTIDPTPTASAGSGAYPEPVIAAAPPVTEILRMWWQRNIIDYSTRRQAALYDRVSQMPIARTFAKAGSALVRRFASLSGGQVGSEGSAGVLGFIVGLVLFLSASALLVSGLLRIVRGYRTGGDAAPVTIDYFNELTRKLKKLGLERQPSQTPQELILEARQKLPAGDQVQWVIDLYYAERFSGLKADPEERRTALRIIEGLSLRPETASS